MDQVFDEIDGLMEDRIHARRRKKRQPAMSPKKEEPDFTEEELQMLSEAYDAGEHAGKAHSGTKWGAHMGGKVGSRLPAPEIIESTTVEVKSDKDGDEPDWEYVEEPDEVPSPAMQKAMEMIDALQDRPEEETPFPREKWDGRQPQGSRYDEVMAEGDEENSSEDYDPEAEFADHDLSDPIFRRGSKWHDSKRRNGWGYPAAIEKDGVIYEAEAPYPPFPVNSNYEALDDLRKGKRRR